MEHTLNQSNKQEIPVALITGAARRIGAAIAKHLHQQGYRVVIHCLHSTQEANILASEMNQRKANSAIVLSGNLSDEAVPSQIIKQSIDWGNRFDLLVNNASVFIRTPITDKELHWDAQFNLNVKAPFLLSQAAYASLAQSKGAIINITDIHANMPLKDYSIYCQSKAALVMQTKSLAREYAPFVRVNAIAPGAIAWPEKDNVMNDALKQHIIDKTPLKQHGHPRYIAKAVLSLAQNPFITGQILCVDGGRSLS